MKELSTAEWHVMESLWADSPKVGSRVVADLKKSVGWSRSTTLRIDGEESPGSYFVGYRSPRTGRVFPVRPNSQNC